MELAEIYTITYEGPEDKLRGMIACSGTKYFCQYIFRDEGSDDNARTEMLKNILFEWYTEADKKLDLSSKPTIKDGDHIMLNGPVIESIDASTGFVIYYSLFGVIHRVGSINFDDCEPMYSTPLQQYIKAIDGSSMLTVHFAVFENAVEARVKVYLTEVASALDLSGVIAARTTAVKLHVCSSILFFKDPDDDEKINIKPEDNGTIALSRQFVAVPLGSKLIIELALSVDDDNKMVENATFFDAKKDGTSDNRIKCSKCVINVEVSWRGTKREETKLVDEDSEF